MPPTQLIFFPNYTNSKFVCFLIIHITIKLFRNDNVLFLLSSYFLNNFKSQQLHFFFSHHFYTQMLYISSYTKPHKISYQISLIIANSIRVKIFNSTIFAVQQARAYHSLQNLKNPLRQSTITLKVVSIDKLSKYF